MDARTAWWAGLMALSVGCGRAPTLEGVAPVVVHPGDEVTVRGTRLTGVDRVELHQGEQEVALLDLAVTGDEQLVARLPAELETGRFDLWVARGEVEARLPGAVQVDPLPADEPCSPDYTANTEVSLARGRVLIDRFYANGQRDTVELDIAQITGVEHQAHELPSGQCSAIYLITQSGGRVVFDDDETLDLTGRARTLSEHLGVPLELREPLQGDATRP